MKKIIIILLIVFLSILSLNSIAQEAASATIQIPATDSIVLLYSMEDCEDPRDCLEKETPDYALSSENTAVVPGKYLVVSADEKIEIEIVAGETKKLDLNLPAPSPLTGAASAQKTDPTSIGLAIIALIGMGTVVLQVVHYKKKQKKKNNFDNYLNSYNRMGKKGLRRI